jgi:hypothetical protein
LERIRQAAENGGLAVVYGHPHSLTAENSQAERWLRPFLAEVAELRRRGRLLDHLPRELVRAPGIPAFGPALRAAGDGGREAERERQNA